MNLKLRPTSLNIQLIYDVTEILRVLVAFLQVFWRQTDQMHLQW